MHYSFHTHNSLIETCLPFNTHKTQRPPGRFGRLSPGYSAKNDLHTLLALRYQGGLAELKLVKKKPRLHHAHGTQHTTTYNMVTSNHALVSSADGRSSASYSMHLPDRGEHETRAPGIDVTNARGKTVVGRELRRI